MLTGILAGISVAFWFTELITLLLLPFLALTPDRSMGYFLADRFRELPLLLLESSRRSWYLTFFA